MKPEFEIWRNDELNSFIKPIIQMSSTLVGYFPQSDRESSDFAHRTSTLLLARIGFEGELFGFMTFRSAFERNLGFSLARNGPVGTSVWEGTASWQARENYIRLKRWGLSLTAGIAPDPASVDYISDNILDSFGMDPYVRDPLLLTGFNQGQSILLRYENEGASVGVAYTGGNPLVSSLAFSFGGEVNQFGTLFSAPLRAFANGFPGSNIHVNLLSPSLMYEDDRIGIKAGAQFYWVDNDVTQDEDVQLEGYNLRASARYELFEDLLSLYASAAYRENDRVDLPNTDVLAEDEYEGAVGAVGFDLSLGKFGLGGNYYYIYQLLDSDFQATDEPDDFSFHYINLGATYWLWEDVLSTGLRWARSMAEATQEANEPVLHTTDSFILSLRLII